MPSFSVSPAVSVMAVPPLGISITVVDALSRKPLSDARVLVDEVEKFTDDVGITVYDPLAPGTYKIRISKSGYKGATKTVKLAEEGLALTVGLWPWWAISLGLVVGTGVATIVIAKIVWK